MCFFLRRCQCAILHQVIDLFFRQRLFLKERVGDQIEQIAVFGEDALAVFVTLIDDLAHFLVDLCRNTGGIVVAVVVVATQEHIALRIGILDRTQRRHTEDTHHRLGDLGDLFDIVDRTGTDLTEDQLLGHTAAQQSGDLCHVFPLAVEVFFLPRGHQVITSGIPARNDRYLLHHVRILELDADHGMSGLVISDQTLVIIVVFLGFLCRSHHDAVDRLIQIVHRDLLAVIAHGQDRTFIENVLQIGTGEARCPLCQRGQRNVLCQLLVAGVDAQDRFTALLIRQTDRDLTVETSASKQRRIQYVRTVGGRNDHDALVFTHTIHLDQQLVQRLFTLVVAAAHAGTTLASDRIDLIDEHDARRCLLRLFEHIAHAARTGTDEHLYEIRTADGEERHIRLTGDRLC